MTERRTEERSRRYERMLARAEQLACMGSWHWDLRTNTLIWSNELHRIYGIERGTPLTYEAFLERVHPEDRARVVDVVKESLEERKTFRYCERIVRPDGEVRVLDSQGDVELDETGQPIAMFGVCRDITTEQRAQHALQERERRFAKMFHASPVATSLTTLADDRFLDVNTRFLEVTGYTRKDLIGRRATELGLWDHLAGRQPLGQELRERGSIREAEFAYRARDGQARRALASIEQIEIDGQDCVLILLWRP